ncbi:MAG: hypothetical protein DIU68_012490 [Chloroflexota bacterium]
MNFNQIQIVVTVPAKHLHDVLDAMAEAGAGVVGEYTHCTFRNTGTGRFKPSAQANPAVGETETINEVEEYRIETICHRDRVKAVCEAIRRAHPYEEPLIYLIPLLDEKDFA